MFFALFTSKDKIQCLKPEIIQQAPSLNSSRLPSPPKNHIKVLCTLFRAAASIGLRACNLRKEGTLQDPSGSTGIQSGRSDLKVLQSLKEYEEAAQRGGAQEHEPRAHHTESGWSRNQSQCAYSRWYCSRFTTWFFVCFLEIAHLVPNQLYLCKVRIGTLACTGCVFFASRSLALSLSLSVCLRGPFRKCRNPTQRI